MPSMRSSSRHRLSPCLERQQTEEYLKAMPYPPKRTPAIEREILERLSNGEPLAEICRSAKKFPHPTNWREWCEKDEGLAIAYARAREAGEDAIAAETLAIIDEEPRLYQTEGGPRVDPGDVANRKLRAEHRLKLLAKWNPKRWGEKVDVTSGDKPLGPDLDETSKFARLAAIAEAVRKGSGEGASE